jgi:solute carrier family 41
VYSILKLTIIVGLPENIGSILVSRLSTALHIAARANTSLPVLANDELDGLKEATQSAPPVLVMTTLCLVILPIEIAFIAILRGIGWVTVPFVTLPVVFLFFFITVSNNFFTIH